MKPILIGEETTLQGFKYITSCSDVNSLINQKVKLMDYGKFYTLALLTPEVEYLIFKQY